MLVAVRAAVGPDVQLRADANRAWKLPEAMAFASAASEAALQVSWPIVWDAINSYRTMGFWGFCVAAGVPGQPARLLACPAAWWH